MRRLRGCDSIITVKTIAIQFFAEWGNALSVVCSVVTAASALTALIHYLRHWRDDEIRLAVEFDTGEPYVNIDGLCSVVATAKITNVGKVPVTVTGFEIVKKSLAKRFIVEKASYSGDFLYQGASVEQCAIITAKERGVPIPKRIPLRVEWAKCGKNALGVAVVKFNETCPARK